MKKKNCFTNFLLCLCIISLLFILLACGDEGEEKQTPDEKKNGDEQPTVESISFAKDIKPIFDENCSCHLTDNPPHGLSLASYDDVKKGSDDHEAFIPNNAEDSLIVKRIIPGGGMPPGGQLTEEQIDKIKKWIDEGGEDN